MIFLEDLFEVSYGHSLELNRLKQTCNSKGVPFVSRKSGDNGIAAFVEKIDNIEPAPAGELTCALSGNGVLSTFIQEKPFYTAFHVARLKPKIELTKNELMFYCLCISKNRYKYSYGRQANRTLRSLQLPSTREIPKWVYDADINLYVGADKPKSTGNKEKPDLSLNQKLSDLFDIVNGLASSKVTVEGEKKAGWVRYVRPSSTMKRTVAGYVNPSLIDDKYIFPKGTLFVSTDGEGSHTYAYVSTSTIVPNSNVCVLIPKKNMSMSTKLFYAMCISKNRYLFSYGRKPKGKRLANIFIPNLSLEEEHEIERYMSTLKFSSTI